MRGCNHWFILGIWTVLAGSAAAADTSNTVVVSTNRIAGLQAKAGFRIEAVASEPAVSAPVAIAFDANGRLFVVERPDSPPAGESTPALGRVRVLENPDSNGVPRKVTTYAENLVQPSAIACYDGGVFVATTPDILYLKDTQTNGVADVRDVALSGIGGTNTPDSSELLHSFSWGLDNRIHGAAPALKRGNGSAPAFVFSFDPRIRMLAFETGTADTGLCADSFGRKFVSDSTGPLRLVVCEQRYYQRNPFFIAPSPMMDAMSPTTVIYKYQLTTAPAADTTNIVPRPGALAAAWLSGGRGMTIYRGEAFPPAYSDAVFIPVPNAGVVHHATLTDYGIEAGAGRAADEKGAEFIWSKSPFFKPVQAVAGPDGALYVVDHGEGTARGGIYRVVPAEFKRAEWPRPGKAGLRELVAALASTNGWHRETAARLLFEKQDPAAVFLLTNMLAYSTLPLARLHALHVLDGLEALDEPLLQRGLRDADARVREHAIQLSEKFAAVDGLSPGLNYELSTLAVDPAARVRHQLALSLGEAQFPQRIVALADIARRDPGNPRMRAAIYSALGRGGGRLFALLADDREFRATAEGADFLRELAGWVGLQGQIDEVAEVLDYLDGDRIELVARFELMATLGEGLHRTRSSIGLVDYLDELGPFWREAFASAVNPNVEERQRVAAIRLLRVTPLTFEQIGDWLISLTGAGLNDTLREAALYALEPFNSPRIADVLISNWRTQSTALRARAMTTLLARNERLAPALTALEDGAIPAQDLSTAQMNFLRTAAEPGIRERALRLLGPVPGRQPQAAAYFAPALKLRGSPERGREIYDARCASCHKLGGGEDAARSRPGPDLTAVRVAGREKLLASILQPNAELAAGYTSCVLRTHDGESFVGVRIADNATVTGLALPDGSRALWSTIAVASATSEGWSIMPENPARGLTPQDMADLLDCIMSAPQ